MTGFTFETTPRILCVDLVTAGSGAAGVAVQVHDAVLPDPPQQVVEHAVRAARESGADGVVGLGGGSSLDTARLVALLARSGDGDALAIYRRVL